MGEQNKYIMRSQYNIHTLLQVAQSKAESKTCKSVCMPHSTHKTTHKRTDEEEHRTANTGFASGGLTCNLGALCSETRPNAKLLTVIGNFYVTTIDKINEIEFPVAEDEFSSAIDSTYRLGSTGLTDDEKTMFRYDLDYLLNGKGRWLIHNTFAGGIIFLREPETINKIEISFFSELSEATAAVEYASENRNSRNVKYKPNAGQIESTIWNVLGIFPNFNRHRKDTKIILIAVVGKMVKHICEKYKKDSWFMQFEKPFDIELFLDNQLELKYRVDIE